MVNRFDNAHFVEVGVWLGKSAAYMAVEIINSNKQIKFDCVDTWRGSLEHQNDPLVQNNLLFEAFTNYTRPVSNIITPIQTTSIQASLMHSDGSLDFVFIDAGHSYNEVKEDIRVWYPKVKEGGVLSGHDYEDPNHPFPDIKKAVDEFALQNQYNLQTTEEFCWIINK
jgi:predicted O-methyltransferase YrrM